MSKKRPEHSQEPAEGGEEDVEAPGTERPGDREVSARQVSLPFLKIAH